MAGARHGRGMLCVNPALRFDVGLLHVKGSNNYCRRVLHETEMVKSCNRVHLFVVLMSLLQHNARLRRVRLLLKDVQR
jgi:hypothetical protein